MIINYISRNVTNTWKKQDTSKSFLYWFQSLEQIYLCKHTETHPKQADADRHVLLSTEDRKYYIKGRNLRLREAVMFRHF